MTPLDATGLTGEDFKNWVLIIAGNVFIVILVVRAVGYFAKREWGELIGHILVAVLIAGFIYSTDTMLSLIKGVVHLIFG
jgi:hypothetical protein